MNKKDNFKDFHRGVYIDQRDAILTELNDNSDKLRMLGDKTLYHKRSLLQNSVNKLVTAMLSLTSINEKLTEKLIALDVRYAAFVKNEAYEYKIMIDKDYDDVVDEILKDLGIK